jgi:hypothetical protein
MAVVLVAKFAGDVTQLTRAYDEAHRVIMERGGAPGELRHHCAVSADALWLIGVWESEELQSSVTESRLKSATPRIPRWRTCYAAEVTVLQLHAIEPPLDVEAF